MSGGFVHEPLGQRIVAGAGVRHRLAAEVDRLGAGRVLVVGGRRSAGAWLEELAAALGPRLAAVFTATAATHVPVEAADSARAAAVAARADLVVAVGGGSVIGLAKAIALTEGIPIVALPTTFSGSEATPTHGTTAGGVKRTGRDPRVLPAIVLYDPDLLAGIPPRLAAASGMNAVAHCVEALWAEGANPVVDLLALDGLRRLGAGLPVAAAGGGDVAVRLDLLVGAYLAGSALASAGTGVHHRTCHVLGGGWNLPHAETHAALLPHSAALAASHRPDAAVRVAAVLGGADAPGALFDLGAALGLPMALRELGMPEADLGRAALLAVAARPDDPMAASEAAVEAMLAGAWAGRRPTMAASP